MRDLRDLGGESKPEQKIGWVGSATAVIVALFFLSLIAMLCVAGALWVGRQLF